MEIDEHLFYFEHGSGVVPKCQWYDVLFSNLARRPNESKGRIRVIAHADTSGSGALNLKLSAERARQVRARLLAAGIEENRIILEAMGESKPPVRTADNVREQLNRLVVVVLPVD
jgi:outer membrane protein OmpA-like peptidoglycan-associated protein